MKKFIFFPIFLLVCCIGLIPATASVSTYNDYNKIVPQVMSSPNGAFEVYAKDGKTWHLVQRLDFDNYFREKTCDVYDFKKPGQPLSIQIVQKGGEAAHIDAVLLDGQPPLGNPSDQTTVKISQKDFDIIDAYGKTFIFDFSDKIAGSTLEIVARVEGKRISHIPFKFPMANILKEISKNSTFYQYDAQNRKSEKSLDSKPFFCEYCIPGTGHPMGYAYGWVWDDPEYLHAYLDITGDNTCDGNKDYAAVHAKVRGGVKTFRVSLDQTQYGESKFEYTDRAVYQHKTYEFKIPKSELDASSESFSLAFSAYGTMAPMYTQMCDLPYNIISGLWWTGLRIKPLYNTSFTIHFFGPKSDAPYQTITKSITSVDGWTGNVDQLLSNPAEFQSPTYLEIYASSLFTVTQFLGKKDGDGFSHQTFYSYPYDNGWPYTDGGMVIK